MKADRSSHIEFRKLVILTTSMQASVYLAIIMLYGFIFGFCAGINIWQIKGSTTWINCTDTQYQTMTWFLCPENNSCEDGNGRIIMYNCDGYPTSCAVSAGFDLTTPDVFSVGIENSQLFDARTYRCRGTLLGFVHYTQDTHMSLADLPELNAQNGLVVNSTNPAPLTCSVKYKLGASTLNPALTVKWLMNGQEIAFDNNPSKSVGNDGYDALTGSATYQFEKGHQDNKVTCQLLRDNVVWTTSAVDTLDVQHPPSTVTVNTTCKNRPWFIEGVQYTCQCSVELVNPPAILSWRSGTSEWTTTSGSATFTATKTENGQYFTCRAQHVLLFAALTDSFQLNIAYGPSAVSLSGSPATADEGSSYTLNCAISGMNPAPDSATWNNIPNPPTEKPGSTGSDNFASVHNFIPQRNDDGRQISCTAQNPIKTDSTKTGNFVLNVNYKPYGVTARSSSPDIKEDDDVILTCNIQGAKPSQNIQWSWSRGGQSVGTTKELPMNSIQRGQSGTYACNASNSLGTADSPGSITIIVKYLDVSVSPSSSTVMEGDNLTLNCITSGEPSASITYDNWFFNPETGVGRDIDNSRSSILTVNNVEYTDAGNYTCSAGNGAFTEKTATTTIEVLYVPKEIPVSTCKHIVGAATGSNAEFCIKVRSNPEPRSFTWKRGKYPNLNDTLPSIETDEYHSSLHLADITKDDFGKYTCEVSNGVKNKVERFVFELLPEGPPNPPKIVSYINVTAVSAVVSWTSPFNGGQEQQFFVEFRMLSDSEWSNSTYKDIADPGQDDTVFQKLSLLVEKTDYEVRVRGKNFFGFSKYSPKVSFTTKAKPIIPPATSLMVVVKDGTATITWGTISGDFTGITVEYCKVNSPSSECLEESVEPSATSITVNIEQGVEYEYRLMLYQGEDLVATSRKLKAEGSDVVPVIIGVVPVIIGVVVSVVVVAIIVIVIVIFMRRRRPSKKGDLEMNSQGSQLVDGDTVEPNGITNLAVELDDDDDVDDPRYACATNLKKAQNKMPDTTDLKTVAESQTAPVDDPSTLYAEVNKPKKQKQNEALYSQPDKTKKKPKEGDNKKKNNKTDDTDTAKPVEALYAQPDKTNKKKKKSDDDKTAKPNAVPDLLYAQPDMSKKKKKKPEPPKKPKDKGKNKGKAEYVNAPSHPETAEGEYANVDVKKKKKKLPSDDGENPYQNVELQDEGENPYQNVEDITEENAKKKDVGPDGTVYADLDFEKKKKTPKKSEIIRTDPATEYAAIDFKRKPEDVTETA